MPPRDAFADIQLARPFGRLTPRKVYRLPLEAVHPTVRIAHRLDSPMHVAERIIFDHELVLILAGEGELVVAGRSYVFAPRDLFFLRPFVPHRIESNPAGPSAHLAVHFDLAPGVPSFAHMPRRRLPYEVRFPRGQEVPERTALPPGDPAGPRLAELLRAHALSDAPGRLRATLCLADVLLRLISLAAPADARPGRGEAGNAAVTSHRNRARLERVLAHVEAHLTDPTASEDLARVAGMSPSHFSRLFRDWTGQSPMDFVRRRRVERARRLLADVDLSIKEIAARSGFPDAYRFSKVFRQLDGLSPSHYREALLAGRRPADQRK